MKTLKIALSVILLLSLLTLQSCFTRCSLAYQGFVYDAQNHLPLDSVTIKVYSSGLLVEEIYSDSSGEFFATGEMHAKFVGVECEELRLVFSKEGYKPLEMSTRTGELHAEIFLTN